MRWSEHDGVAWLEADLPGARVAFSTRIAGDAKSDPERVAGRLGIEPDRLALAEQVHGVELIRHAAMPSPIAAADGHVLTEPGPVALVRVADCLPIALSGPGGVAMLHCGWRGLSAGIIARGADAVQATAAAIGPGIGPCCYEVGPDVLSNFEADGPISVHIGGKSAHRQRGWVDLAGVARGLLGLAGVAEVESAGLCTCCDERFFSHRRDGAPGRQAGLAWLEAPDGGEAA